VDADWNYHVDPEFHAAVRKTVRRELREQQVIRELIRYQLRLEASAPVALTSTAIP
jgi:hypothetical protein